MKILISAAEASSDAHGAELLKAIRSKVSPGEEVIAYGVGGPKLKWAGLRIIVDARQLLVMGFVEVLGRLPVIWRSLRKITKAAFEDPPDVVVLIDFPDFHFQLAKRLSKMRVPLVYYIPPKVWVWRKKRVEFLKKYFSRILCIFPFEESFYQKLNIPVKYVGNPLVDQLPLKLTKEEARRELHLDENTRILILMPGSRQSELKAHLSPMIEAACIATQRLRVLKYLQNTEKLKVLLPFPVTYDLARYHRDLRLSEKINAEKYLDIQVTQGDSAKCLVAADAGLIKSGTSTLEAALLGCPHSIIYKPNLISGWIFKYFVRYKGPVGLVNLVAGWIPLQPFLITEILCEEVTAIRLADEIVELFTNSSKRQKLSQVFQIVKEKVLGKNQNLTPSLCAAEEIIHLIRERKGHMKENIAP